MSEAMKRIKEQSGVRELPKTKHGNKTYYFDQKLSQLRNVKNPNDYIDLTKEELEEQIRKTQAKIADKKEELRRKKEDFMIEREQKLTDFKKIIIHQIEDEETGVLIYEKLIEKARELKLDMNVRDLQLILADERRHLSTLNAMRNTWISYKSQSRDKSGFTGILTRRKL